MQSTQSWQDIVPVPVAAVQAQLVSVVDPGAGTDIPRIAPAAEVGTERTEIAVAADRTAAEEDNLLLLPVGRSKPHIEDPRHRPAAARSKQRSQPQRQGRMPGRQELHSRTDTQRVVRTADRMQQQPEE
jgi:hypothetical protein